MKRCGVLAGVAIFLICLMARDFMAPRPTEASEEKAAKAVKVMPAWQQKWEDTLAAAKKEGKVSVSTFVGPETRNTLAKAFKAKYGIDLELSLIHI